MDLPRLLERVPDYREFFTLEELRGRIRTLCREFPGLARLETVGESSEGRPIELQTIGHGLFLGAGLAWAFYTVAMRKARLDGLHAAAISAVGSMVLYLPVFAILPGGTLAAAQWSDIALQAIVQGVLTAIVSLLLYGRAVSILGASSGAAFSPRHESPANFRGDPC